MVDSPAITWTAPDADHPARRVSQRSVATGDECANVGTITSVLDDGTRVDAEGVFVYRVDERGLILSLRAFWEIDRAMATARPYAGDLPASRNP